MTAHRGKFIAYYRVSTDKQGKSGLGLEAQRQAVETYLNGGSWTLVAEFVEVESGKHSDGPRRAHEMRPQVLWGGEPRSMFAAPHRAAAARAKGLEAASLLIVPGSTL
jgi:hypothetical protein